MTPDTKPSVIRNYILLNISGKIKQCRKGNSYLMTKDLYPSNVMKYSIVSTIKKIF